MGHTEHHQLCVDPKAYKQRLFQDASCLPLYCGHFSKFNKVSVSVCKDDTSGTKANSGADVPNEENMDGEGGTVQLVSGKVDVLCAYIIQEERGLTTRSLHMTTYWLS